MLDTRENCDFAVKMQHLYVLCKNCWVIPCQLSQRSLALIFDFAIFFFRKIRVMKAKYCLNVMDEYLLSNPLFCRGGSK